MPMVVGSAADFDTTVAESPMVLADFYTEWCAPCKMMAPILEKLDEEWGDDVKVVKVDIEKVPELGARYGIMSVPTLMLFKAGEVKDQLLGARDARALREWVEKHSA